MKKELSILVSNDDGIDSPGIFSLVHKLREIGNVTVVAPDRQQSAVGHSLTIASPLRITPFERDGEMFGYSINGTPSDCVKIAISSILDIKPDIVVAGINHGQNTAINILYSGTVSAATEGMLSGIPSMAISLASHNLDADMSVAAEYAKRIALEIPKMGMPKDTFLNVNVPNCVMEKIKGVKIVHHSNTVWKDKYEKRNDPFGREYFWFSGEYNVKNDNEESDDVALGNDYVTINPIQYNITNHSFMQKIRHFED